MNHKRKEMLLLSKNKILSELVFAKDKKLEMLEEWVLVGSIQHKLWLQRMEYNDIVIGVLNEELEIVERKLKQLE